MVAMADQTADIRNAGGATMLALVLLLPLSSSETTTSKVNDGQCVCTRYCLQTVL